MILNILEIDSKHISHKFFIKTKVETDPVILN